MNLEQEYLLYLELKACLEDSRNAFIHFQTIATPKMSLGKLLVYGASQMPGWRNYIETVALPLNRRTYRVIKEIAQLPTPTPAPLLDFVRYHSQLESSYVAWKHGYFPEWDFTSGYHDSQGVWIGQNFPSSVEIFVNRRLAAIVDYKEIQTPVQPQQETNMASKTIGGIAFIVGLGVGAVATIFAQPFFLPTDDLITEDHTEDFVTAADINDVGEPSGALLDSLQGITVSGHDAELVTVRVLGIERAKAVAMWGTKGINGDEPTTFRRIADLDTAHLINIRDKSTRASTFELAIINSVLEDRVAAGDADESVLDD